MINSKKKKFKEPIDIVGSVTNCQISNVNTCVLNVDTYGYFFQPKFKTWSHVDPLTPPSSSNS